MTPLPKLSAPAQRALASAGVSSLEDVAKFTKIEILGLHGVGMSTILPLEEALRKAGLGFRN
jgi:hypothetical protein